MRFLFVLSSIVITFCAVARPGLVQTVDGRSFNGDVQYTNGTFVIDATNTVSLTNILTLSFDSPQTLDLHRRGTGIGLLGYYFSNTNFSGDVVVRLDEN